MVWVLKHWETAVAGAVGTAAMIFLIWAATQPGPLLSVLRSSAAAGWAQCFASVLAVIAAYWIGRAQITAQHLREAENRRQFAALVVGICERAHADIVEAVKMLDDKHQEYVMSGEGGVPSMTATIQSFRALDFNRMPSAEVALAANELRRLCGWAKKHEQRAVQNWKTHGRLSQAVEETLIDWRTEASKALDAVKRGCGTDLM